ncbi:16S rRNA (guanine(527)-N(7))-methyltransferase RsmG [Comamonas piscis]|uniref:Ribosomal RNA small subunit methyltransferase G n=1 Tax=Comamonas piscis TaxID=1562974 RepID=A0A7G5ECN0_9BURK|nr:16S rRNA (guanine(527)-N(7))-methyltransferase RsmG [Comamonas piscis]QMV71755.1 16S rRNA (guanine(527)-N(7))-methyltransferase RsmG [Comamonas piscis]WSO34478.1 16S rRNA (guanine(527)-N(7))-methyltransferase RsmG [Comamonas piscis]
MSALLEAPLRDGVGQLGLSLDDGQIEQLMAFLDLLQKWNKVYNLTSLRDPQEMLTHHMLDSLAAVPPLARYLAGKGLASPKLLDVGSGGGLPAVVFAICLPELDVSCVDTVGKKVAFIQQVAAALRLRNLHGIQSRVEQLSQQYDVVSCRAFAALQDFTAWSAQTLRADGIWLAMKAKKPDDELASLPATVQVLNIEPLKVPGLDAERCIVWMQHQAA